MGALSPRQFSGHGEQLAMFMTPGEIIDTTQKADYRPPLGERSGTPREQWEKKNYYGSKRSLKDEKTEDLISRDKYKFVTRESMPPVSIRHTATMKHLTDGHHRLAFAELDKMPWVPVTHAGAH